MENQKIKAIGYVRVSSLRQEDNNRYSFQEQSLIDFSKSKGWDIEIVKEVRSAKDIAKRPKIKQVLERLKNKEASILLILNPDRLVRNTADAEVLMKKSLDEGWVIWPLNLPPQSSNQEAWNLMFRNMISTAVYELETLSRRTKEGLKKAKEEGHLKGRLPTHSDEALRRINYLRTKKKLTYAQIAEKLNEEKISTARPEFAKESFWTERKVDWAFKKIREEKRKNEPAHV